MADNLDDLEAEFSAEGVTRVEGEGEGEAVQHAPLDEAALQAVCVPMIKSFGDIACRRANVTPLEDGEIAALASAAGNVLALYDMNVSPVVAAWFGLAATAAAVVTNREPLVDVEDKAIATAA